MIARSCTGQRPSAFRGGISLSLCRRLALATYVSRDSAIALRFHARLSSARIALWVDPSRPESQALWNEKTRRLRGVGVQAIGELGLNTRALVQERERTHVGGKVVGQARAVLPGLDFHAGQGRTLRFGLDDSRRLPVHVEKVVRLTVPGL